MISRMIQRIRVCAATVFCLFVLTAAGQARSLYYYEDFSSSETTLTTNGWNMKFCMSRDFWVENTYNTRNGSSNMFVSNQPANARMIMRGDPNADSAFDQWYTGKGALFRPVSNAQLNRQDASASAEQPFGFQIVRYGTFVHRDNTAANQLNNVGNFDEDYGKGLFEVWMAEDNGAKALGDSFENFIFWYDKAFNRWCNTGAARTRTNNVWGYFDQYERDYSGYVDVWTNMTDIDGNSLDPNTAFRRQFSFPGGLPTGESGTNEFAATNELGIKMTHDGKKVSIYLNLDPAGDNSGAPHNYLNSWIKFAEVPVAWTNKLAAYFAAESPTPDGNQPTIYYQYVYSQLKHFLIRSVNSNLTASVYPTNTMTNALVTFKVLITNYMGSTNESGIAEIAIRKPASFVSNWILTNVWVSNVYGIQTNTNTNMNPPAGRFSLTTNASGEMVIRFRATAANDHRIVMTNGQAISVSFSLYTPSAPNSAGDAFEVYADSVKHADSGIDWVFNNTTGIKYATTGRKKAVVSFPSGLTVRSYTQPGADGEVSVSRIPYYEGSDSASYTYKLDTSRNASSPEISSAVIAVPDTGFTAISNITSKLMGAASSNFVYFTNYMDSLALSNCIYIDYHGAGYSVAGVNGSDKITFDVYGTADLDPGVKFTNYQWKSWVNSDAFVAGAAWMQTTNTNYGRQFVTLISRSPRPAAGVTPYSVAVNSTVQSNSVSNFTLSVQNAGDAGNDILLLAVHVPAEFTNIERVKSSWLGGNTNANSYRTVWTNLSAPSNIVILIDYTNAGLGYRLPAGSNDMLTFGTIHQITNLDTNALYRDWAVYGDNGNTEGFVLGEENLPSRWGVWISPPLPAGENRVVNPLIYTSDITNTVTNVIWNTSPLGVGVRMARITLSPVFTNLIGVRSAHVSNTNQNILVTNRNGTNVVFLYYQGTNGVLDGNGLLESVNDNPMDPDKDTVVLTFVDRIDWDTFTNTNYQLTNLVLQTAVFKTNAETSDTNLYSDCTTGFFSPTNFLTVEYPPVLAEYRIETNKIDTTTVTNTLHVTLTNTGLPGNRIRMAVITLPVAIVSNITNASSSLLGNINGGIASNTITANYELGGKILDGLSNDVITFDLVDKIDGMKYGPVAVDVTAQNDRETVPVTNVQSGGSGTLEFDIPKPRGGAGMTPNVYFTGTNETQDFLAVVSNAGQGTDVFQKVRIAFPASFTNRVTVVHSRWLGQSNLSVPALIQLTPTNVTVYYSNQYLPAGSNDVLTVRTAYSNLAPGVTDAWTLTAFNGFQFLGDDYYELLTNRIFGSTNTFSTERPGVNLTPTNALTTDLSNVLEIVVRNGTNAASSPIQTVKVDVPYPYQTTGLVVEYSTGKGFAWAVSNGGIYLDYGTNFTGNSFTSFKVYAPKAYITVPTDAYWTNSVFYYGDSGGFRDLTPRGTNSLTVTVVLPDSQSYAAVTPRTVGKDLKSQMYALTVTNIGVIGNDIQMLKILPPFTNALTNIITNISGLSNVLGGRLVYTNGYILVDYAASNTNLTAKKKDTVFFIAWDNQALPGFQGAWTVYAANTTNTNTFVQSQTLLAGDLNFEVVQPGYQADFRVTPNAVDTSLAQTTFQAVVNNSGGFGNDVRRLRISLPGPFVTNGAVFSTVLPSAGVWTNMDGTNYVELVYASNVFVIDTNDIVTLTVPDSLDLGDTNVWISVMANYYTSEETFAAADVKVGTNLIAFVMPQPSVRARFDYNEVFTTHGTFTATYRFINTGQGSNRPRQAWISIPAVFTNAAMTFQLSPLVTNTNYAAGVLRLDYSNFTSQMTDTVVMVLTNKAGFESNVFVQARFYNGQHTNDATNLSPYDHYVNVVNPPSASVTPLSVLATEYTNDLVLFYNNNSSGVLPTLSLRVDLPAIYTNVVSAASSNGVAFVSNTTVYVTNFGGGALPKNSSDRITLRVMDGLQKGISNNNIWTVRADNGTGFGRARESILNALNQSFVMPSPSLEAHLINTFFYVCTNASVRQTNTLSLRLVNTGSGANSLSVVRIVLPVPPASPFALTNTVAGSFASDLLTTEATSIQVTSNVISIYYTNELPGGFATSLTDTVSFDLDYLILDSGSYPVTVVANNESSAVDSAASTTAPETLLLSMLIPEQKSRTYIYERPVVYTLDTNAVIGYKIENESYAFGIQTAWIAFDTNAMTVDRLISSRMSSSNLTPVITNFGGTNWIRLDYGATPVEKRTFDNVGIAVRYSLATNAVVPMPALIRFAGSPFVEETLLPESSTRTLAVEVPDFGRVAGAVLPGYLNASVKVVQSGTDTLVTNKFGTNILGTAASDGFYLLDFVPGGSYDVVITSPRYKDIRLAAVIVETNAVTNIGTNVLRHSPLNARDTSPQEILAQQDSATRITVYPNTLIRNFSIDIWLTNMFETDMQTASTRSKTIASPADPVSVTMYWVDMRDLSDSPMEEQELTNDVLIVLHYEDSNVAAQGWDESKLAVYYWRPMTKEWIRLGGAVDTSANTVTIQAGYLHKYYAVFGEGSVPATTVPGFSQVRVEPKVFTPRSGSRSTANAKISVVFDRAYDQYTVKIYDLRGNLVKSFERSGSYSQGEVYWDGHDDEGYAVKGGVYIYRIQAGQNVYSGTIIVVR